MPASSPFSEVGKILLVAGLAIAAIGGLFLLASRVGLPGRLPGDFIIRGKNTTVWLPLASCLILSLILTLIFNLFRR